MASIHTTQINQYLRNCRLTVAALAIACLPLTSSLSAYAADCEPPTSGPGVHKPVGADASLYTYNCDNGYWESAHYRYDPATGETTSTDEPVYTYNTGTGSYDTTIWVFSAPNGNYITSTKSVASPPAGATVVGGPPSTSGNSISGTGPNSNNTITNNGGSTNGSSIHNTGPSSNNTISGNGTSNTNLNNQNSAQINTNLSATANTGNALILGNTGAGSAQSGDAQSIANVMNLLQSSSNALNGDTLTFVANIDGDVNGDLTLDPNVLGTIQPAATGNPAGTNNLTINNGTNATLNNTIDLSADSGDATVSDNTKAGDATSGSARTIANVVNMIQSAVSSGRSFLGVINVNGNLNGDILLPPDFVDQLIAANVPKVNIIADTGPSSNNAISNNDSSNTNVTNTNNQGITNNINAHAQTGSANVSSNTSAGNAKTGSTKTSITAFNLTGSHVVGSNALLVFVNVSGEWVGLIVNAPAGATAAALGGGVTTNHTDGSNNTTVHNTGNYAINNDITLASTSGDASVTNNTEAGSATSGDASSAVNLLNVQDSVLSLANWFGVLFINVFGSWHGSFGMNTSAGDPTPVASSFIPSNDFALANLVGFNPTPAATETDETAAQHTSYAPVASTYTPPTEPNVNINDAELTAAVKPLPKQSATPASHHVQGINWFVIIGSAMFFATYAVGDRFHSLKSAKAKV